MAKVAHNHPTIDTVDGRVATRGPTDRPCIRVPADSSAVNSLGLGEILYVVIDGTVRRGRFVEGREGPELRGVYDTPDQVREPGQGENWLATWVDDTGLGPGRTVHVDIVRPNRRIGLRAPGHRGTYEDPSGPDDSLKRIAEDIDS